VRELLLAKVPSVAAHPVTILADVHEPDRMRAALHAIGVPVVTTALDVGDYVVARGVLVERKSTPGPPRIDSGGSLLAADREAATLR
jgi:hypothetical protein